MFVMHQIKLGKKLAALLNFSPRLGVITTALIVLVACQSESTQKPDSPLTNTYWKLTSLQGESIKTYEGNREMFLQFRAEGFRGYGGCNRFFGAYTNTQSKISFQPIAVTEKFCQQSSQQESKYIGSLVGSVNYEIDGESMHFSNLNNQLFATFSAIYF
jgi:putative lipoprotein